MTFLDQILAAQRDTLAAAQARTPQAQLERQAAARRDYRGFTSALAVPGVRIVAEIKRASPSLGIISSDLDPAALARAYADGGAAALSVLTEPVYFKGSANDLQVARAAASLPVLRKDFIIDPYQVYETAAMGADALLLIVRLLDDERLHTLHALALSLGLDVLTEIYDEQDAQRARALGATLVGINNRDLAHFTTDITQAARLAAHLPPATMTVALSGIHTTDDIRRTLAGGIRRFLVGEALVRQADPAATLREWIAVAPALPRQDGAASGTGSGKRTGTTGTSDYAGWSSGGAPLANLKICGITSRETAEFCADRGIGALGAVFYAKSPRCVTPQQARDLFAGLPSRVSRVGVFVDGQADAISAAAREAKLDTIQLHGAVSMETLLALQQAGFRVIQVLKVAGAHLLETARALPLDCGVLVECGRGSLPGGNGAVWNWDEAAPLADVRPFALAGGLTPENIVDAARRSHATAWDVSSGVECAPGVKDCKTIKRLTEVLDSYLSGLAFAHQKPLFWSRDPLV